MKPATTIVTILLVSISAAHLLRLIFQVEIIVGGFHMPAWLSLFGFIIPLVLALLLWREDKKIDIGGDLATDNKQCNEYFCFFKYNRLKHAAFGWWVSR
jgi:hypothetical protein